MSPEAYHLLIDVWETTADALRWPAQCALILEEMRRLAQMEELADPLLVYASGEGKAWGPGISGIVLFSDSHESFHGLENYGIAHLDLFSCHRFDWEAVAELIRERLGGRGQVIVLDRSRGQGHKVEWRRHW